MQYLSKAYNFYSGINPATLSGAIDVIVVRHVHSDGEVTLASSPFHVRFGKLQVLRAGEKRVTIRLPNNLPSPHIAPFSMKVGETGEAFFVLETTDEVPEDLLTSPVVMASDPDDLSSALPASNESLEDEFGNVAEHPGRPSPATKILTKEPFGETEERSSHEHLADVDFLDLNASRPNHTADDPTVSSPDLKKANAISPSSILDSATSLLPSIPFLPSSSSSTKTSPKRSAPKRIDHTEKAQPPNPLTAQPGEDTDKPIRDEKLSELPEPDRRPSDSSTDDPDKHAESKLPKVKPGEGDGPKVKYGKDVVFDMAGYHSEQPPTEAQQVDSDGRDLRQDNIGGPLLDSFTRDLLTAINSIPIQRRPPLNHDRLTDSALPSSSLPAPSPLAAEVVTSDSASAFDISVPTTPPRLSTPSRYDRGRSEPPLETDSPSRVNGTLFPKVHNSPVAAAAAMDYAWDWGRIPQPSVHTGDVEELDYDHNMERSLSGPLGPVRPDRARADSLPPSSLDLAVEPYPEDPLRLRQVEKNPYMFTFTGPQGASHSFELALCGTQDFASSGTATVTEEAAFLKSRVSFQQFMEDPDIVDDPSLVVRYSLIYLTWFSGKEVLRALALFRRSLTETAGAHLDDSSSAHPPSGSGWSRWWRRSQLPGPLPPAPDSVPSTTSQQVETPVDPHVDQTVHYAKTLRLSSDQLKQLNLKPGPNTIQFSVSSSYSGVAMCTARIFLWDNTDQVVISDIDGTITKSDALGHVFAVIGRDWTHLGIAKLYTDICNNGYKIMYLTSRAIGQADSTREYLKSIAQGEYRLPEGPVIMSPDRLMASLHREVIMRKPELFKMACLRDIQRLFEDKANEAFYAGFGNRITDAMSYRSVGVQASKIYTIDSTGVVKTELLQAAGHRGSYVALNDLVNEVFPPVTTKFKPEFTDFNYWRTAISDIPLPDLTPPSPALSARSDTSSRYNVLGKIASIGRRSSRQAILPTTNPEASSRPSSPLIGPAMTPDELSEDEGYNSRGSMPGSFEERGQFMPRGSRQVDEHGRAEEGGEEEEEDDGGSREDSFDDGAIFDDDILAAGEMKNVPF